MPFTYYRRKGEKLECKKRAEQLTLTYSRSSFNLESWSARSTSWAAWPDEARCSFSRRRVLLSIFLLSKQNRGHDYEDSAWDWLMNKFISLKKLKELPKNLIFLSRKKILRSRAKRVWISCCFFNSSNLFSWASLTSGGSSFYYKES
jgi:hypothetical protein